MPWSVLGYKGELDWPLILKESNASGEDQQGDKLQHDEFQTGKEQMNPV